MKMVLKFIQYTTKGNFFYAEEIIRTLKNEIYKYMTAVSKNVHTDKLDKIFSSIANYIIERSK